EAREQCCQVFTAALCVLVGRLPPTGGGHAIRCTNVRSDKLPANAQEVIPLDGHFQTLVGEKLERTVAPKILPVGQVFSEVYWISCDGCARMALESEALTDSRRRFVVARKNLTARITDRTWSI